jgi:hypothetical protein
MPLLFYHLCGSNSNFVDKPIRKIERNNNGYFGRVLSFSVIPY